MCVINIIHPEKEDFKIVVFLKALSHCDFDAQFRLTEHGIKRCNLRRSIDLTTDTEKIKNVLSMSVYNQSTQISRQPIKSRVIWNGLLHVQNTFVFSRTVAFIRLAKYYHCDILNAMPVKRGLVAPQNIFIQTIIKKFDGSRK